VFEKFIQFRFPVGIVTNRCVNQLAVLAEVTDDGVLVDEGQAVL